MMNKYFNKKVVVDGIKFDSKKESKDCRGATTHKLPKCQTERIPSARWQCGHSRTPSSARRTKGAAVAERNTRNV